MARICSKHQHEEPGCKLCHTEIWELLDISQEAFAEELAYAESEGTMTCPRCLFGGMYRATCRLDGGEYMCPCCGVIWREHTDASR